MNKDKMKINYFNYLLIMKRSKFTDNAILVLDIKHRYAFIRFKNNEYESRFNKYIYENRNNKVIDIDRISKIASRLALDEDGDTVLLDIFIAARENNKK